MNDIANFIYELGSARRILRSHKQFIGTSDESISDHTFRVIFISLILASLIENTNREKVIMMALIHDIPEIRTGDLNPINKLYCKVNEENAFKHQISKLPIKDICYEHYIEYVERKSLESKIVKDADVLDQLALQIEYSERGVTKLDSWNKYQLDLLVLEVSKNIAKELLTTSSFDWLHQVTLVKNSNHE
jgi:putative hydrolase of HD superfamily